MEQRTIDPPQQEMLSLKDLTVVLIKHFGHHEGLYELAFGMQLMAASVNTPPGTDAPLGVEIPARAPGAVMSIVAAGLSVAKPDSPSAVDAAIVNPAKPNNAAPSVARKRAKK